MTRRRITKIAETAVPQASETVGDFSVSLIKYRIGKGHTTDAFDAFDVKIIKGGERVYLEDIGILPTGARYGRAQAENLYRLALETLRTR